MNAARSIVHSDLVVAAQSAVGFAITIGQQGLRFQCLTIEVASI